MDLAIRYDVLWWLDPVGQDGSTKLLNRVGHWCIPSLAGCNAPYPKEERRVQARPSGRCQNGISSSMSPCAATLALPGWLEAERSSVGRCGTSFGSTQSMMLNVGVQLVLALFSRTSISSTSGTLPGCFWTNSTY